MYIVRERQRETLPALQQCTLPFEQLLVFLGVSFDAKKFYRDAAQGVHKLVFDNIKIKNLTQLY